MAVEAVGVQVLPQKTTGKGGKAFASDLLPGLGQFTDGRKKEGVRYLVGTAGLYTLGAASVWKYMKDVREAMRKVPFGLSNSIELENAAAKSVKKGGLYFGITAMLISAGLWIANIVDAYKGGKKNVVKSGQ